MSAEPPSEEDPPAGVLAGVGAAPLLDDTEGRGGRIQGPIPVPGQGPIPILGGTGVGPTLPTIAVGDAIDHTVHTAALHSPIGKDTWGTGTIQTPHQY